MLETVIKRFKNQSQPMVVYTLKYGGQYIIVKALDLAGSLHHFDRNFSRAGEPSQTELDSIYGPFYRWVREMKGSGTTTRFSVKVLCKVGGKIKPLDLLKFEQEALWKAKTDSACLNTNEDAYIPKYDPIRKMYGWFDPETIKQFNIWKDEQLQLR